MTSAFDDAASILDATVNEASVRRPPLPAGEDFIFTIGEPKSRKWTGKADPSKSGIAVDIPLELDISTLPGELATQMGGTGKITIVDGIMLDTTPQGGIDMAAGKNAKLRRYREALEMNEAGKPFSFRMMQGRQIRVKIKHDLYEGETYDKADSVAKV